MSSDVQISQRLPAQYINRADRIAKKLAKVGGDLPAFDRSTRSAVLRLAIARGLASLESDLDLPEVVKLASP